MAQIDQLAQTNRGNVLFIFIISGKLGEGKVKGAWNYFLVVVGGYVSHLTSQGNF